MPKVEEFHDSPFFDNIEHPFLSQELGHVFSISGVNDRAIATEVDSAQGTARNLDLKLRVKYRDGRLFEKNEQISGWDTMSKGNQSMMNETFMRESSIEKKNRIRIKSQVKSVQKKNILKALKKEN